MVKYPGIKVQLTGTNGNAFAILAKVQRAMRDADVSREEVTAFLQEAQKSDYDHLLQTCMRWVTVN